MVDKFKPKTYKTKEKAAAALGITVAQLDVVGRGAWMVYQEVGYDLAELNGGRGIPRNEVIEVVLDAGRLEQLLQQKAKYLRADEADVKAAVAVLSKHDHYAELCGAMRLYFTAKRYE